MMKCPNCSAKVEFIEGESEICSECGSELKPHSNAAEANSFGIDFTTLLGSIVNPGKDQEEEVWNLSARSKAAAENIDSVEFDTTKSNKKASSEGG